MPYVSQGMRELLDNGTDPMTSGELNYLLTKLVTVFITRQDGGLCYDNINAAIGALECSKFELYRRVVAGYEDKKMNISGDVYPDWMLS